MGGSVVVPAYNEAETIGQTLDSLRNQDAEQVLVVVDGDDETDEVAADHDAVDRVIDGPDGGVGAARNRGAACVESEVVLFTDADTVVPEDWVTHHLRHYQDQGVVGVGGPATPVRGRLKDRVLFKLLSDYWYRISWPLGFVQQPGFNCSFRREAFLEAGGFDETLPFMEDTELSLRMKKHGRIVYDPDVVVATSARREASEGYFALFTQYARGYFDYFIRGEEPEADYFNGRS